MSRKQLLDFKNLINILIVLQLFLWSMHVQKSRESFCEHHIWKKNPNNILLQCTTAWCYVKVQLKDFPLKVWNTLNIDHQWMIALQRRCSLHTWINWFWIVVNIKRSWSDSQTIRRSIILELNWRQEWSFRTWWGNILNIHHFLN